MAKKTTRSPVDQKKKLLITAIKKVVKTNSVLPILEDAYLTGDEMIVSDLETYVSIPYKVDGLPEGGACVQAKLLVDCLEMMDEPSFSQTTKTVTKPIFLEGGDWYYGDQREVRLDYSDLEGEKPIWIDYVKKTCRPAQQPYETMQVPGPIQVSAGNRKVKLAFEDPDNFPVMHQGEDLMNHLGEVTPEMLEYLKNALCFVSNDSLRPAMTGVQFDDHIAATDAHRLYFKPITPMLESFILPEKTANILLSLGSCTWQVYGGINSKSYEVSFLNDEGVYVKCRPIDARFPDWKVVIPDRKSYRAKMVIADRDKMIVELKNAIKFCNKATHQVVFGLNGKVTIAAQDVDFDHSYENTLDFAKAKFLLKKDEVPEPFDIGFNGNMLSEMLHKQPKDQDVTIMLWGPTKACVINDECLLMPLMLNQ
jgi:DNA polymerase-3 subunit beta